MTALENSSERAISRAIVEGYRRIAQGHPDEWGDLSAQLDANTADLLERLNHDERQHGLPPWSPVAGVVERCSGQTATDCGRLLS